MRLYLSHPRVLCVLFSGKTVRCEEAVSQTMLVLDWIREGVEHDRTRCNRSDLCFRKVLNLPLHTNVVVKEWLILSKGGYRSAYFSAYMCRRLGRTKWISDGSNCCYVFDQSYWQYFCRLSNSASASCPDDSPALDVYSK